MVTYAGMFNEAQALFMRLISYIYHFLYLIYLLFARQPPQALCEECQLVFRRIEDLVNENGEHTIKVNATESWEYNTYVEIIINWLSKTVTINLDSYTGSCDCCMGEDHSTTTCSIAQFVMIIAHRGELSKLIRDQPYDPLNQDHHRTVKRKWCSYYSHEDHCGLILRTVILGEDMALYNRHGDHDDESDGEYESPIIPGLNPQ